jgi:hypothetical protein
MSFLKHFQMNSQDGPGLSSPKSSLVIQQDHSIILLEGKRQMLFSMSLDEHWTYPEFSAGAFNYALNFYRLKVQGYTRSVRKKLIFSASAHSIEQYTYYVNVCSETWTLSRIH